MALSGGMYHPAVFDGLKNVEYHAFLPSKPKEALNIHSRYLFSGFWKHVARVASASFDPFALRFFHNALMSVGRTIRLQEDNALEELADSIVLVAFLRRFSEEESSRVRETSMTVAEVRLQFDCEFDFDECKVPWEMLSETGQRVVTTDLLALVLDVGRRTFKNKRMTFQELNTRLLCMDAWGMFQEENALDVVEHDACRSLARLFPAWALFNTACSPKEKRFDKSRQLHDMVRAQIEKNVDLSRMLDAVCKLLVCVSSLDPTWRRTAMAALTKAADDLFSQVTQSDARSLSWEDVVPHRRRYGEQSKWTVVLLFAAKTLLGLCVAQRFQRNKDEQVNNGKAEMSSDDDDEPEDKIMTETWLDGLASSPWSDSCPLHDSLVVWTTNAEPQRVKDAVALHNMQLEVDLSVCKEELANVLTAEKTGAVQVRMVKGRGNMSCVEFLGTQVMPLIWSNDENNWNVLAEDIDEQKGMVFLCRADNSRLREFDDFMWEVMGYEETDSRANKFKGATLMRAPVFGCRRNNTLCRGRDFVLPPDEKGSGVPHMFLVYVQTTRVARVAWPVNAC